MATIKRNGGNVVLKDGKVACGCCRCFIYELYPSANYEAGYNFEDLPDETVVLSDVVTSQNTGNITLYKELSSVNGYVSLYQAPYTASLTIAILLNFLQLGWRLVLYSTDEEGEKTIDSTSIQSPYLQYLDSDVGRNIISFANSYIVNTPSVSILVSRPVEPDPTFPDGTIVPACDFWCEREFGPRPIDVPDPCTIFRKNPGLWIGSGASLYFDYVQSWSSEDEFIVVGDSFKWKIKTPDGTFEKFGTQDTPVGSYAGGFTVS